MKVAIDISPLKNANRYRGIGIYTQQLVKALQLLKIDNFSCQLVENKKMIDQSDLIHYPFFDLFFSTLPLKKAKPTVVTIHDVIYLVFPDHYPPGIKGTLRFQRQKLALKGVKAVITDSENSKEDIVNYLNYPRNKIHVVRLAPAKEFKQVKAKNKYQLPEKFILYVGDVNYNKNIPGLIKALAGLKEKMSLVLVGKAFADKSLKETREIFQLIKSLKLEKKVICLGWLSDEDLVDVYNLASVYCQPSFYEGFGLPVLEAMACGCPVVAAEASSLPEICGPAAIMINPYDTYDMIRGLQQALNKRRELVEKGLLQAKKFSWERTAQKTYEVYQKMVR